MCKHENICLAWLNCRAGFATVCKHGRHLSSKGYIRHVWEINETYNFLEENKLLDDCQFCFRRKGSTKLAATLFCDRIRKEMDKENLISFVYLDLSKAFDTIGKLSTHIVERLELAWLTDYLFNRTQLVEIQNTSSKPNSNTSGAHQGSILGPFMFIVFFNDLK